LALYDWPGNVRELRNAMERATLMARGGVILPEHLPRRVQEVAAAADQPAAQTDGKRMAEVERIVILQSLREHRFNRSETARALGISRRALIYKLHRFAEEGHAIRPD
jgi:two-component system response regulator AtoC